MKQRIANRVFNFISRHPLLSMIVCVILFYWLTDLWGWTVWAIESRVHDAFPRVMKPDELHDFQQDTRIAVLVGVLAVLFVRVIQLMGKDIDE